MYLQMNIKVMNHEQDIKVSIWTIWVSFYRFDKYKTQKTNQLS